jgi:hypothetical protein
MIRLCIGTAPAFLALLSNDNKWKTASRTMDDLGPQHNRLHEMIYDLGVVEKLKFRKLEMC